MELKELFFSKVRRAPKKCFAHADASLVTKDSYLKGEEERVGGERKRKKNNALESCPLSPVLFRLWFRRRAVIKSAVKLPPPGEANYNMGGFVILGEQQISRPCKVI